MLSNFLFGILGGLRYVDDDHAFLLQFGFNLGLYELYYRDPDGKKDDEIVRKAKAIEESISKALRNIRTGCYLPQVEFGDTAEIEKVIQRTVESFLGDRPDDCALVLIGASFCFLTSGTRMVKVSRRHEVRIAAKAKIQQIDYLCSGLRFPVNRFWEVLRDTAETTDSQEVNALRRLMQELRQPLHILMVSADPTDLDQLQLSQEERALRKAVQGTPFRTSFEIYTKSSCSVDEINEALNEYKPSILHFSGHGSASGLYFRNSAGQSEKVRVDDLARVCRNHPSLRAVILNACYSNDHAECVRREVDYVITMEKKVMDKDAIRFTSQFYKALGYEGSIEGAFSQAIDAVKMQSHKLQPKILRKDEGRELSILESSRSPIMKKRWWQGWWLW
jgi:hypothetical protein